ncbi:hypothetical protein KAJ89_04340 [Candidatus Parcubacteria bacterium]|nr:hypothetical protein [Candidatus Parcubacteria bacterium]
MGIFNNDFFEKWQTLIGSALGAFIAIIGSLFVFFIKSNIAARLEKKEYLRIIEISITRTLNDLHVVREEMKSFNDRLTWLIEKINSNKNTNSYCFDRTNFPALREIFFDNNLPTFKVRSYYLHNKILIADSGIKSTNEQLKEFKNDFSFLISQNERMVSLRPDPDDQRTSYANNIKSFKNALSQFTDINIQLGIKILNQVKIYNDLLRKKWWKARLNYWKYEGTWYKYFKHKNEQEKYRRTLACVDRIDEEIKYLVKISIGKVEKRSFEKFSKN